MAKSIFLKISGVQGESKNGTHTDTIELDSYSWSMAHPTSFDSGGGLSAGETTFGELNCMGTMDKAFQTLFGKTAKGTVLDEVKITGCKMGDKQMDYFEITLTKALCSALNVSSGGDELMVSYSFVSTKIKVEYWLQAEDGGQGASSPQEWDVKANK